MKIFLKAFGIMLLTFFLFSPSAFAIPVPIQNASFEFSSGPAKTVDGYGTWTTSNRDGWNYSGDTYWGGWTPGDSIGNFYSGGIPDGNSIFSNSMLTFDNLQISNGSLASVPEPAMILLLGSGLVGLAGLGRKKFSRSKK